MKILLEELHTRVHGMLDPENPLEPERKYRELLNMADGFLFLSKSFLKLAEIANKAADSMVSKEANEQLGPPS